MTKTENRIWWASAVLMMGLIFTPYAWSIGWPVGWCVLMVWAWVRS